MKRINPSAHPRKHTPNPNIIKLSFSLVRYFKQTRKKTVAQRESESNFAGSLLVIAFMHTRSLSLSLSLALFLPFSGLLVALIFGYTITGHTHSVHRHATYKQLIVHIVHILPYTCHTTNFPFVAYNLLCTYIRVFQLIST